MGESLLEKYRSSNRKHEIHETFKQDSVVNSFIWQNINGRRFLNYIARIEPMSSIGTVHITFKEPISYISPDETLYLKLSHNETICKLKYIAHGEQDITVYFPDFIKAVENRMEPRFEIKSDFPIYSTIAISSDLTSKSTQSVRLKLIDISYQGLSIYTTKKQFEKLLMSEFFVFTHLNGDAIHTGIQLTYKYSTPFVYPDGRKAKNALRVGFHFDKPLSQYFSDPNCFIMPNVTLSD